MFSCYIWLLNLVTLCLFRGGFKEWPLVKWSTRPLPYGPRRPLMKINKKNCITAAKMKLF